MAKDKKKMSKGEAALRKNESRLGPSKEVVGTMIISTTPERKRNRPTIQSPKRPDLNARLTRALKRNKN